MFKNLSAFALMDFPDTDGGRSHHLATGVLQLELKKRNEVEGPERSVTYEKSNHVEHATLNQTITRLHSPLQRAQSLPNDRSYLDAALYGTLVLCFDESTRTNVREIRRCS